MAAKHLNHQQGNSYLVVPAMYQFIFSMAQDFIDVWLAFIFVKTMSLNFIVISCEAF